MDSSITLRSHPFSFLWLLVLLRRSAVEARCNTLEEASYCQAGYAERQIFKVPSLDAFL